MTRLPLFRRSPVADFAVEPRVARRVDLVHKQIDIVDLFQSVVSPAAGAVSLFIGTVRDVNDGRAVSGIDYEAYHSMAQAELERIVEEVETGTEGLSIAVVHRLGTLAVGEISVAIAAAHPHRAAAVKASQLVIEQLKQRVPIWKQEHYIDGDRKWIDPTSPLR